MDEKFYERIGMYCSYANDDIYWHIDYGFMPVCGGKRYACYSAWCSRYMECGCPHYGNSNECKMLLKYAEQETKEMALYHRNEYNI